MFRGGAGRRRDARGQTHIDFVVGIVLFLLAFTFVVAAVPQLLAPYDDQATPVVADRVSASLTESLLIGDKEPGVLEPTCVDAYFGGSGCGFSPSDDPAERSGVDTHYRVHVQITGDLNRDGVRQVLYYDGTNLSETGADTDKLEFGPSFKNAKNGGLSLDRQLVLLDGMPVTLEVRVW